MRRTREQQGLVWGTIISMSDDLYPLIVTADCGHAASVVSEAEQAAFEEDHRVRCDATEFLEQVDNFKL